MTHWVSFNHHLTSEIVSHSSGSCGYCGSSRRRSARSPLTPTRQEHAHSYSSANTIQRMRALWKHTIHGQRFWKRPSTKPQSLFNFLLDWTYPFKRQIWTSQPFCYDYPQRKSSEKAFWNVSLGSVCGACIPTWAGLEQNPGGLQWWII